MALTIHNPCPTWFSLHPLWSMSGLNGDTWVRAYECSANAYFRRFTPLPPAPCPVSMEPWHGAVTRKSFFLSFVNRSVSEICGPGMGPKETLLWWCMSLLLDHKPLHLLWRFLFMFISSESGFSHGFWVFWTVPISESFRPDFKKKTETELTFWYVFPYFVRPERFQSEQKQQQVCASHNSKLTIYDQNVTKPVLLKKIKPKQTHKFGHKFKFVTVCHHRECHKLVTHSVWLVQTCLCFCRNMSSRAPKFEGMCVAAFALKRERPGTSRVSRSIL